MGVKYQVIIEIDPQGDLKVTSKGIKGSKCITEIKPLCERFGKIKEIQKTQEYYEKEDLKQKNKQAIKAK
ncbi:MAG: DUF2997 domain-containing protein [Oligoflexia bacterium]|nr:DUF2997 domain-containing protein [Oligoflexia bacterium]